MSALPREYSRTALESRLRRKFAVTVLKRFYIRRFYIRRWRAQSKWVSLCAKGFLELGGYVKRIIAFWIVLLFAAPSFSQSTTGDILGTVTDSTGALVTGARVVAKNLLTNAVKETTSSEVGAFRLGTRP